MGHILLNPGLARTLRPRLEALNPDVTILDEGHPTATIASIAPPSRLGGSVAALTLLIGLSGAGTAPSFPGFKAVITW